MPLKKICGCLILWSLFMSCQSQTKKPFVNDILSISKTELPNALKLAYVGNMGVLLEHHNKTVIIDGLHQFYHQSYSYPSINTVDSLITGTYKDFSPINFCLFTHVHGDHFSERYALKLLKNNPDVIIMGAHQIKDSIQKITSETQLLRAVKTVPYNSKPLTIIDQGIEITGIQCNHSSPRRHGQIKNIAYYINLDDYNIIHIGDTDWELTVDPFKTLDVKRKDIDLAILPYWMLLERNARKKAIDYLAPKHIIATHIPPNFSPSDEEKIRDSFSNITLLTRLGETLYYKK